MQYTACSTICIYIYCTCIFGYWFQPFCVQHPSRLMMLMCRPISFITSISCTRSARSRSEASATEANTAEVQTDWRIVLSKVHETDLVICSELDHREQVTWLAITEVRSVSAGLFAGTWRPLVIVITTMYYVAIVIFHRRVWYRALSLPYGGTFVVRASSSSPSLPLCQISFLSQPPLLS